MDVNDLPLLELFTRLREAGLPLGIDEYKLVLRAIQGGFGISNKEALQRLCQTLWVKSDEEKLLFEYHFEQLIGIDTATANTETVDTSPQQRKVNKIINYLALVGALITVFMVFSPTSSLTTSLASSIIPIISRFFNNQSATPSKEQPIQTNEITPETTTETENSRVNQNQNQETQNIPNQNSQINWVNLLQISLSIGIFLLLGISQSAFIFKLYILVTQLYQRRFGNDKIQPTSVTNNSDSIHPTKLTQVIEDEIQVAQAVLQVTSRNLFILTSEYFPVTERQMKQSWRSFRRSVREGAATEFDIEATVNQIGRQGLLLQPVLIPPRVNRAKILLLIDQDGSMVPFHALSNRLAETALRGGRLGKAGTYYFHNCPIDYLYQDPYHQQAVLISHIVTCICSENTGVLIFSDAGAARGGFSEERYNLTKAFLEKLQQRVRYISWLNPMPKKRWSGTTAGEISHLIPMFEISPQGVQAAIGVLRGYPSNFEGRRI